MTLQEVLKENQIKTRERIRKQEQENRKNKIILTGAVITIMIMLIAIISLLDYNISKDAYTKCINKGHTQNYCISKL